jgi:hypothetical protein
MVATISILNPTSLMNKAQDSVRKKDLNKLKTAFEEYANDKREYPDYSNVSAWNIKNNCGKTITEISNYLHSWPCDPNGEPYTIIVGKNWYKIVTNLGNKKDRDIPDGWYGSDTYSRYTSTFARELVNYGVSSTNVLWYNDDLPGICDKSRCYSTTGTSRCNAPPVGGCVTGGGIQCYLGNSATGGCGDPICPVDKCN